MQTEVSSARSETAEQAAVRSVIDALYDAVRSANVEAWLAQCAQGITTFDMVPPLKHEGADAIRRLWAETIDGMEGIEYAAVDQEIDVEGDIAFSRSVNRFSAPRHESTPEVNWLSETLCLRRIDGFWKLVHSHVSVPFDMETGKALLELEPADG
jgi:ketosteroid isomerase-like protein